MYSPGRNYIIDSRIPSRKITVFQSYIPECMVVYSECSMYSECMDDVFRMYGCVWTMYGCVFRMYGCVWTMYGWKSSIHSLILVFQPIILYVMIEIVYLCMMCMIIWKFIS